MKTKHSTALGFIYFFCFFNIERYVIYLYLLLEYKYNHPCFQIKANSSLNRFDLHFWNHFKLLIVAACNGKLKRFKQSLVYYFLAFSRTVLEEEANSQQICIVSQVFCISYLNRIKPKESKQIFILTSWFPVQVQNFRHEVTSLQT